MARPNGVNKLPAYQRRQRKQLRISEANRSLLGESRTQVLAPIENVWRRLMNMLISLENKVGKIRERYQNSLHLAEVTHTHTQSFGMLITYVWRNVVQWCMHMSMHTPPRQGCTFLKATSSAVSKPRAQISTCSAYCGRLWANKCTVQGWSKPYQLPARNCLFVHCGRKCDRPSKRCNP